MKVHLIDTHVLVPRSRLSAKVKVRYQGHLSQKMDVSGTLVFHKHILFLSPLGAFSFDKPLNLVVYFRQKKLRFQCSKPDENKIVSFFVGPAYSDRNIVATTALLCMCMPVCMPPTVHPDVCLSVFIYSDNNL